MDEETGMIVYADPNAIAAANVKQRSEIEIMMDLLKEQADKERAEYESNIEIEEEVIGPDGKPLLPDVKFDLYGRIIDPATGEEVQCSVCDSTLVDVPLWGGGDMHV